MYKDVKKKLLSVALCICMIIGLVQVVPRVQAADDDSAPTLTQTVEATQVGNTKVTATFNITLDWCSRTYDGNPTPPEIKSWSGTVRYEDGTEDTISSINGDEDIVGLNGSGESNAKLHYGTLVTNNKWNFKGNEIKYAITQANFSNLFARVKSEDYVLWYNGQNRIPASNQIEVTADVKKDDGSKETITIDPSQYTVTGETNKSCGEQTCAITVHSDNYASNKMSVGNLEYVIAYNMKDATNCTVTIDPTDIPWSSTVTPPAITLYTEQTKNVPVTSDYFKITYYKNGQVATNLNSAGTYTVKVEPKLAADYILVDDQQEKCFGNYYEGTFNVTYEGTDSLKVYAVDPKDPKQEEKELDRLLGGNLTMRYNNGEPVEPTITKVVTPDGDNIRRFCDVSIPGSRGIGRIPIYITPHAADTNYKDTFYVYYNITSGLNVKTCKFEGVDTEFEGADSGKIEIAYDGEVHKINECEVRDEGNNRLRAKQDYEIKYQYWKEDEAKYVDATDKQLKDRGKKRALIVGLGVYDGNEYPLEYEITPIDLSQGGVTVTFAENSIPYTGEPVKPVITSIEYKGMSIDAADWENEFEFVYVNNTDAGTAVLKLRGKEDNYAEEYVYPFTITELDLAKAQAEPYRNEYTGSSIVPKMVIGTYELKVGDYKVQSFDHKTGETNPVAPVDVGSHTMEIVSLNPNIGGSCSVDYEIIPHTIKATEVHLAGVIWDNDVPTIEWNGGATHPGVVVGSESWKENRDYRVSFNDPYDSQISTDTVSAAAIVTGLAPNYDGEVRVYYKITPRKLSNEGVKVQMPDVSGAPRYTITATLTDARPDGTKSLTSNNDYTVEKVWYWDGVSRADGSDAEWTLLTKVADYQIGTDSGNATISNLTKAGNYRVLFEGEGDYAGTRTETVKCGTDISGYWAHIDDKTIPFPYNGSSQTPKNFSLYNGDSQVKNIQYSSDGSGDFLVDYERDDDVPNVTESVGKIYVTATGNPEKGYFGKTNRADRKYGYYEIVPPEWTENNLEVAVADVDYRPLGKTTKPKPVVTFAGISLNLDEDYTLTYVSDCDQAGEHSITVTGKGNYAGQSWTCYYWVRRVDISDTNKVHQVVTEANYNDISKGTITLKQGDYVLQEGNQDDEKDYTKSKKFIDGQEVAPDPDNPDNLCVTYELRGYGNYTGTITIKVLVRTYNLSDPALWADSKDTAKPGQFYIEWVEDDLVITDPEKKEADRMPVQPSQFQVVYKRSETGNELVDLYPLNRSDYTIKGYGDNQKAGQAAANYVVIEGQGGYTGEHKAFLTLYTQINNARPAQESLIKENAVIKRSQWKKIYDAAAGSAEEKAKALLKLEGLSFDEQQQGISQEEYDLSWPAGFNAADPEAGTYTVTVNGAHKPSHYYHGKVSFTFEIRDDIEGAQIVVGNNDTMTYEGKDQAVELTANDIRVTVGTTQLTLGTDYEILDYTNNTEIGDATVHLKGKGKYEGEVYHPFKITYSISKLIVFVRDPNGDWQDTRKGPVQYSYTGSPIEPAVKLYCPADFAPDAEIDPDDLNNLLPTKLYDIEYSNNTDAGDATIIIKSQYLTDGSPDPRRHITFKIGAGMIAPPKVTYKSSKGYNLNNLVVTYMGEPFEVDRDLGITLEDGSLLLKEGEHYKVWFDGDRKNVTDPNHPTKIHFDGLNNYAGSTYAIPMTIQCKEVTDPEVEAPQVMFTYTDNVREQNLLDAMKLTLTTPANRKQALIYGTDYTITGYYMDAGFVNEVPLDKGVYENGRMIPKAPGSYYAKVAGKGNFTGERAVAIVIEKRNLTDNIRIEFVTSQDSECIVVNGVPDCTYNGKEHHPAIQVTYGIDAIRLVEGRDYEVSYGTNVDAGEETASVTVTMIDSSNYEGEATRTFTIKQKDIAGEDMDYLDRNGDAFKDEAEYEWTKQQVRPTNFGKVRDTSRREDLTEGKDYTIDYQDHNNDDNQQINAGEVEMIFSGSGNYTGEKVFTYYIGEDISRAYTLVNGKRSLSVEYNGLVQAPKASEISVETAGSGNLDLIAPDGITKRYAIQYFKDGFKYENRVDAEDFVNAGTYYVAVVGVPELGTYAKSSEQNTCTYKINPRSISPSYVLVSGYDATYYYTGQAVEPKGITVEDTDLPVAGEETSGRKRTVKLIPGTDYDLSYANNTGAGKASIIVAGKGNYAGNRVAYFNILSSNADGNNTWDGSSEGSGSISNGTTTIAASDIILGYDNSDYNCMMYNGYERIPTVTINGINTNEFIITASNNIYPGVATLAITGRGNNFTGTIYKNYRIKANLAVYGNISAIEDQVYSGYQITPHVTVTCGGNLLNPGRDYTLTYRNNTNVGRATVTATATNDSNYIGSVNGGFNISNTAGGMEITGYASSYTYTGYAVAPDVVVTMNGRVLNRGTDYTVTYSNNTNVGTATMTVTGIGSFSGTKTINYTIEAKNIENCLTTAVDNFQYTGSTYTPNVSVTDSSTGKTLIAGTDYMITYSNNTNPGTASITITALSKNYTGSKVIPFKITSASVSGLRTSAIKNNSLKLAWSAQDYADGYQICNSSNRVVATTRNNSYTVKGLTSCTTYRFKVRSYVENADGSISYGGFSTAVTAKTLLNTPKLKAASTRRGTVTLTWSKVAKATGYEIYYSTKKNGVYTRLKTVSKSSSRRYVDRGLASGERYYYTIRAYRTTNGVKTYSSYNTIKSVKVK